jgi:hypothetical protein
MMQMQLKRRMLDLKFLSPGGSLTIDTGTLQPAARQPFGAGHYRSTKRNPFAGPFRKIRSLALPALGYHGRTVSQRPQYRRQCPRDCEPRETLVTDFPGK